MERFSNYINGEFVAPVSGRYFENYNPSTGKVDSMIPDSDIKDVARAVSSAKEAFNTWSQTSVEDRAKILFKISELIEKNKTELAEAESRDQGKPVHLAASVDIPRSSLNFRYFAGHMLHRKEEASHHSAGAISFTSRKPVGVTGLISPWNLPLYLLTWKIAPALAAGNVAVCKPSEFTSRTAVMLGSIMNEAGLPKGVCNIVLGRGATAGQALTSHPDVPLISFTGGTETGKKISTTAAPQFKKLSLELGGKNPTIIFDDVDVKKIVPMVVRSAFLNQGEICLCGSRIYVQEGIFEEFKKEFVESVKNLRVGDPKLATTFMGPLVSKSHMDKVESYVEGARADGAEILVGGTRPQVSQELLGGYFYSPTIVAGVKESSAIQKEEVFGPVATLQSFKEEEEVLKCANETIYGLSASIWTESQSRALRVSRALDVGTVWVNTWMLRDLKMPFGGVKASGLGREGADHSIDFFTEVKTVCLKE